jgi:glycyl-tRNA synthetase beta chain
VNSALFRQDEEVALSAALDEAKSALNRNTANEKFSDAMTALAQLRPPVDAFFEAVTVNDDDPALRANRLRFLSQITSTLEQVADFSKIEG